eukprot:scaffold36783_cov68-Phaeocystis_antarctica.AAC.8
MRRPQPVRGFATTKSSRSSARRPVVFATSPTLHLRHQYPHMGSRAGKVAGDEAAVMHLSIFIRVCVTEAE